MDYEVASNRLFNVQCSDFNSYTLIMCGNILFLGNIYRKRTMISTTDFQMIHR